MLYFIIAALATIAFSIVFIAKTYSWLYDQKQQKDRNFFMPQAIVERAYRGIDFKYNFRYIKDLDNYMMRRFNFTHDPAIKLVQGQKHMDYIIKDACVKLADEIMKSGCIEMRDEEDFENPYARRVGMRVKVYQPIKD